LNKFKKASKNISCKFKNIELIEYNGSNNICIFKDIDNGIFEDKYSNVLTRGSPLIDRVKKNAVDLLKERFNYLTLIEYNRSSESVFLDSEYGEFSGKFSKVVSGNKRHPSRTAKNKSIAAKRQDVKDKRA